jgi:hypothetical protein
MVNGLNTFRGMNGNFSCHDEGNSGVHQTNSVADVEDFFLQD